MAVCARTGSVHSTRWRRVRVVARPYGRPLVPPVRTRDGVIMLRVLADFVAVYCIASEVRWKLLFCKVAWSLSISDGRQARPHSVETLERARCAIYTRHRQAHDPLVGDGCFFWRGGKAKPPSPMPPRIHTEARKWAAYYSQPADDVAMTNAATLAMSSSDRRPPNAGMAPLPLVT